MTLHPHTLSPWIGMVPGEILESERAERLLTRCAQRDEQALEELYQLVSARLFGILLRMLRRRTLAEQALQDVIVRIWQQADQYVAYRGRALAWITAIARYRAIDLLSEESRTSSLDKSPPHVSADVPAAELDQAMKAQRLRTTLSDCLARLNEQQRMCLTLAYIEGYSQEQIAASVESPRGTVKGWVRRALAGLKRCLDA